MKSPDFWQLFFDFIWIERRLISEFRQSLPDHLSDFILNQRVPNFDGRLRHDESGTNLFVFSEKAYVDLIITVPINELQETWVINLKLIWKYYCRGNEIFVVNLPEKELIIRNVWNPKSEIKEERKLRRSNIQTFYGYEKNFGHKIRKREFQQKDYFRTFFLI